MSRRLRVVTLKEVVTAPDGLVVQESFDDKDKTFGIQIIQPGRSMNNTVYSDQNMGEIVKILNDKSTMSQKMYIDHGKIVKGKTESRSLRDWAATILEAFSPNDDSSKGAQANVQTSPFNPEIYTAAKEQPEQLGVSIDGAAIVEELDDAGDGKPGIKVHQIVALNSVDFVTQAAAGGGVLMESFAGKDAEAVLGVAEKAAAGNRKLITIIKEAKKITSSVKPTSDLLLKLMIAEEDDDEDDTEITSFSKVLKAQQSIDKVYNVYYAVSTYVRQMAFKVKADLDKRIEAAQDAVDVGFRRIEELIADADEDEVNKILQSAFDPVLIARSAIVEDMVNRDIISSVDAVTLLEAESEQSKSPLLSPSEIEEESRRALNANLSQRGFKLQVKPDNGS